MHVAQRNRVIGHTRAISHRGGHVLVVGYVRAKRLGMDARFPHEIAVEIFDAIVVLRGTVGTFAQRREYAVPIP